MRRNLPSPTHSTLTRTFSISTPESHVSFNLLSFTLLHSMLPLPYSLLSLVFPSNSRALPSLSYLHHSAPSGHMFSFFDLHIPPLLATKRRWREGEGRLGEAPWEWDIGTDRSAKSSWSRGKHNFKIKYEN